MKTITQDLFYEYTFLSDLNYNPGKTKAVFVKSNIDTTTNGYLQHLWLYDHGTVKQLTSGAKEANYCWKMMIIFYLVHNGKKKMMSYPQPFIV